MKNNHWKVFLATMVTI